MINIFYRVVRRFFLERTSPLSSSAAADWLAVPPARPAGSDLTGPDHPARAGQRPPGRPPGLTPVRATRPTICVCEREERRRRRRGGGKNIYRSAIILLEP